ncbi:MAG TPA: hypothetical protein VLY46_04260 [Usitatibacter sp.]|nr:hypothetical protein [Usitatibacter sp.]
MIPGVTLREVSSALVCAMLATILFCARQGYVAGDYRQAAMLLLFAAPFSLAATVVLLLPAIAVLKRLGATSVIWYAVVPATIVLAVYMAPVLLNSGVYGLLRVEGRSLIDGGKIVWKNFGWMVLSCSEPAFWAALAALLFRRMTVRRPPLRA